MIIQNVVKKTVLMGTIMKCFKVINKQSLFQKLKEKKLQLNKFSYIKLIRNENIKANISILFTLEITFAIFNSKPFYQGNEVDATSYSVICIC